MQGTDTTGDHWPSSLVLTYLPETFAYHGLNKRTEITQTCILPTSSVQTSSIATTMFGRRINTRRTSFRQRTDAERLLPGIELHEYPIDTITDASPLACHASQPKSSASKRKLRIYSHETLSFDRIRRVASFVNLDKLATYLDSLTDRPQQQHLRRQFLLLQDGEEQDTVKPSSEKPFKKTQGKGRLPRLNSHSGSDAGLRSTINWYFWSPEAGKNCSSLEFLLMHLAPTHIWL